MAHSDAGGQLRWYAWVYQKDRLPVLIEAAHGPDMEKFLPPPGKDDFAVQFVQATKKDEAPKPILQEVVMAALVHSQSLTVGRPQRHRIAILIEDASARVPEGAAPIPATAMVTAQAFGDPSSGATISCSWSIGM